MSRSDEIAAMASSEEATICGAMVSTAYFDPDDEWALSQFVALAQSDSPRVRALSATCIGHLARIHRRIDRTVAMTVLSGLLNDDFARPYAKDAIDDLDTFAPANPSDESSTH